MTDRDDGLAAAARGDHADAIRLLEPALAGEPDFEAVSALGRAYAATGRHDDSVKAFTRAVQIEPASAPARFALGTALESGGWRDQASEAYRQALMLDPSYQEARDAAARVGAPAPPPLPAAGGAPVEPISAAVTLPDIDSLRLTATAAPRDPDAQTRYGAALSQLGRHSEAFAALSRAIDLSPRSAQARYNLAVAYEKAGRMDDAENAYWQAAVLDPQYREAVHAHTRLRAMRGETEPPAPLAEAAPDVFSLRAGLADIWNASVHPSAFYATPMQAGLKRLAAVATVYALSRVVFLVAGALFHRDTDYSALLSYSVLTLVPYVVGALVATPVLYGMGRMFDGNGTMLSSARAAVLSKAPYLMLAGCVVVFTGMPKTPRTPGPEVLAWMASHASYWVVAAFFSVTASLWTFYTNIVAASGAHNISKWAGFGAMLVTDIVTGTVVGFFSMLLMLMLNAMGLVSLPFPYR